MERHQDLTEIINGRFDAGRLNAALTQSWELHGRNRYDAVVPTATERRLRRRHYAERYGVTLPYEGE